MTRAATKTRRATRAASNSRTRTKTRSQSRTRAQTRTAAKTRRAQRTDTRRAPARRGERGRATAAQKAYARRAQRTQAVDHAGGHAPEGLLSLVRLRLPKSRASFVLLMMSLMSVGVVLTLWLSTQAIADSYRLDKVRAETSELNERAERLQREVAKERTVGALDEKARDLGMVPAVDPARILVTDKGKKKVFGEPQTAQGSTPPAPQTSDSSNSGNGDNNAADRSAEEKEEENERNRDNRENAERDG